MINLALPKITVLKIRATRVEMQQNMRAMAALAHSFHATNDHYPFGFGFGSRKEYHQAEPDTVSCDVKNDLGFHSANCKKLRYYYMFNGEGGYGNLLDASLKSVFTIQATSHHFKSATLDIRMGSVPPTKMCSTKDDEKLRFLDSWTLYETWKMQVYDPNNNSLEFDALKNCL